MPIVAQLPNQVEAVLVRHTQVADQDVGARLGKRLDRCAGAVRCGDDGADSFQHQDQDPAGVGFVIYDEHAHAIETDRRTTGDDWDEIRGFILASIACGLPLFTFLSVSAPRGWEDER